MTDQAAILPTPVGPVGAIVSEPSGPARGALILLQGGGAPCRAGINATWARLARSLADRGIAVLRFDFIAEGDSTMVGEDLPREVGWRQSANLTILRELAPWFRERTGVDDLLLAGSCHGGRVALELAAENPGVQGTFLIVPYLWNVPPNLLPGKTTMRRKSLPRASELFEQDSSDAETQQPVRGGLEAAVDESPLGENLVETCRRALGQGEVWILIGEGDSQKPVELKERLGDDGERLELEIVPGMILHPVTHPEVQEVVAERLTKRLLGAVDASH